MRLILLYLPLVLVSCQCDDREFGFFSGQITGDLAAEVAGPAQIIRFLDPETAEPTRLEMHMTTWKIFLKIYVVPSDSSLFGTLDSSAVTSSPADSGFFVLIHHRETDEIYLSNSGVLNITLIRPGFVSGTVNLAASTNRSGTLKRLEANLEFNADFHNLVATNVP